MKKWFTLKKKKKKRRNDPLWGTVKKHKAPKDLQLELEIKNQTEEPIFKKHI